MIPAKKTIQKLVKKSSQCCLKRFMSPLYDITLVPLQLKLPKMSKILNQTVDKLTKKVLKKKLTFYGISEQNQSQTLYIFSFLFTYN